MRWVFLSCALLSLAIGYYTAGPLVPPEPPPKETVEEVANAFADAAKAVGEIPEPMVTPNRAELTGQGIRQWIADPTKLVGVRSLDRVARYFAWQADLQHALGSFDLPELQDAMRREGDFYDLLQKDPLGRWTYDLASQVTRWLSRLSSNSDDEGQIRELIDQGGLLAAVLENPPKGLHQLAQAIQHQTQHSLRKLHEKILDLRWDAWSPSAGQGNQFAAPMSKAIAVEYEAFLKKEIKPVWEQWLSTLPRRCRSGCPACATLVDDITKQIEHLFPPDSSKPTVFCAVLKVNGRMVYFTQRRLLPDNTEVVVLADRDGDERGREVRLPAGALGPTQLPPAEQIRKTYRDWRERPPSWLEEPSPPRVVEKLLEEPEWRWFSVAVALWQEAQEAYRRTQAQ